MKKYLKALLGRCLKLLKPKPKIQYYRFGYNPQNYLREDLLGSIFGTRNLYKHFQAKKILQALDIDPTNTLLDYGCGSGFMSIEFAKLAKQTLAVDINPDLAKVKTPDFLNNRLSFEVISEEYSWDHAGYFDRILLSEVVLSVENPAKLLKQCHTLLSENGKLIVVNGLGKYFIRDHVYNKPFNLKLARIFFKKMPTTYREYEKQLCSKFGNSTEAFMSKQNIINLLKSEQFDCVNELAAPKRIIVAILELQQFVNFLSKQKKMSTLGFMFLRLLFFWLNLFPTTGAESGFIGVFKKRIK